jgi:hypothetical protein
MMNVNLCSVMEHQALFRRRGDAGNPFPARERGFSFVLRQTARQRLTPGITAPGYDNTTARTLRSHHDEYGTDQDPEEKEPERVPERAAWACTTFG